MKGSLNRYSSIFERFDDFVKNFDTESIFIITPKKKGKWFIQFAIIERLAYTKKITFGLPRAEWCLQSFDTVIAKLKESGLVIYVRSEPDEMDFVEIELECTIGEIAPIEVRKIIDICLDTFCESRPDEVRLCTTGLLDPATRQRQRKAIDKATKEITDNPRASRPSKLMARIVKKIVYMVTGTDADHSEK